MIQEKSKIWIRLMCIVSFMCIQLADVSAQSLDSLWSLALVNNPNLIQAAKQTEIATVGVDTKGILPDPTLSFGYFLSPVETRLGAQNLKISISQMFPWFGSLSLQKSIATQVVAIAFDRYQDQRHQLFVALSSQYYKLEAWSKKQVMLDASVLNFEQMYTLAQANYQSGKTDAVDLINARQAWQTAKSGSESWKLNYGAIQQKMTSLLGIQLDTLIASDTSLIISELSPFNDADLNEHLQVEMVKKAITANDDQIQLSHKSGLPNFGVGLDYVAVSPRPDAAPDGNGRDILMPMVSVSLPIHRKKYKSQQKQAELQQEALLAQLDATTLKLQEQIAATEAKLKQALLDYELQQMIYQDLLANAHILLASYQSGQLPFDKLLEIEQRKIEAKLKEIEAYKAMQLALVQLKYLYNEI